MQKQGVNWIHHAQAKTLFRQPKGANCAGNPERRKTVNQLASEYGIHPNVHYCWKKQALENLPKLFEDEDKGERDREIEHERHVNEIYSEIGRLTTQLNWLKKIWLL